MSRFFSSLRPEYRLAQGTKSAMAMVTPTDRRLPMAGQHQPGIRKGLSAERELLSTTCDSCGEGFPYQPAPRFLILGRDATAAYGCPCPVPVSLMRSLPSSMTPILIPNSSSVPPLPRFSQRDSRRFSNFLSRSGSHRRTEPNSCGHRQAVCGMCAGT